jgi:tetratricopeptide (TPR) repeat protein
MRPERFTDSDYIVTWDMLPSMEDAPGSGKLDGNRWESMTRMRRVGTVGLLLLGGLLLALDPFSIPAARWLREGDALWAEGRVLSARKAYQKALPLRPADPALWHRLARLHMVLGELEEAEAAWARAAKRGDPWAARGQAELATRRGDREEAQRRWEDWARRYPEDLEAYARWAEAALALGDEVGARAAWEAGLARRPDDPMFRFRLGLLQGATDPKGAWVLLNGLPSPLSGWADLLPDPAQPSTLRRWGLALVGGRYWGEARVALARWLEQDPGDPIARSAMGYVLGRLGQEGEPWLQQALSGAEAPPEAHYFAGLYLLERGRYAEAQERFAAAYQRDPHPVYAMEQGRAAMLAGDLLTAERWLRQAATDAPGNVEVWNALATLYLGHQIGLGKGIEAALEILQRDPQRVEGYEWLGWARYLQGDFVEAERLLQQATGMAPGRASAHYRLGVVMAAKGRWTEARRLLERTVLLDPTGDFGSRAIRMLHRIP